MKSLHMTVFHIRFKIKDITQLELQLNTIIYLSLISKRYTLVAFTKIMKYCVAYYEVFQIYFLATTFSL